MSGYKRSDQSIAEPLRALLRATGMTQEGLARSLDVSLATVTRWVAGSGTPCGPYLGRLRQIAQDQRQDDIFLDLTKIAGELTARERVNALKWSFAIWEETQPIAVWIPPTMQDEIPQAPFLSHPIW